MSMRARLWITAMVLLGAACFAAADGPMLSVPMATAPVIDGAIGDGEWSGASSPWMFVDIASGNIASRQPAVWLSRDDAALYVAASLPLPPGKKPVAAVTVRDGAVWEDDAFEVFLDPVCDGEYKQLIVNSVGNQWDSLRQDGSWNGEWTCAASVDRTHWSLEMRIPFTDLGVEAPKPGDTWRANFAWDCKTPEASIASWGHIKGALHQPGCFGALTFAEGAPTVQVSGPVEFAPDRVSFAGSWCAAVPAQAELAVARIRDGQPEPVGFDKALHPGSNACAAIKLSVDLPTDVRFTAAGQYVATLTVNDRGNVAYRATAPLVVPPPMQVALNGYFLKGELDVDVDLSGLGAFAQGAAVRATLKDSAGEKLDARNLKREGQAPKYSSTYQVGQMAPGEYSLELVAIGRKGGILHTQTVPVTVPAKPEWLGSQEGISTKVLDPWTPVELEGGHVRVWGRDYAFGPLPFPTQAVSAGENILAGPVSVLVVADGKESVWKPRGEIKTVEARPEIARLGTAAAADGIICEGTVSVEYDGMVVSDFEIKPSRVRQLDQVSLIIPIKEEHAKYLYHYPGRWGSTKNAGNLPPEGFTSAFKPFIWLGDNDRGLAWFSESDQGFVLDDPDKAIEITRDAGVVTLRVNMVRGGMKPAPLKYSFGFQATPVKPLKPDVWDYRICHAGNYGIEDTPWREPATLSYPGEGTIRLDQGTFEAWVKPGFDTQPKDVPADSSRGSLNRNLFELTLANGNRVGFYWNIDDRGMRVYYRQDGDHPLVLPSHAPLRQDEWHHVAFTWGDKTCIFIDGVKVAEKAYKGTVRGNLAESVLILGPSPSEFAIDDIRISDIPRESFDLTQPAPDDEHTMLLDRLDNLDPNESQRMTHPEKGLGAVANNGKVINGKWGYGFSLFMPGEEKTMLDCLASLGVRTICFHEHWTDIQNYTSTTHGERLRKLVKACHERGMKLLLYFGYEMSNIAPEWDLYANECLVAPLSGGYHRLPEQKAYIVCYNSPWQDFMADGIANVMDEYDIDGVYLDGTANPWACRNMEHGCGYDKGDGTVGATYPILATREMMRRLYTLIKARKPDGQVNVHQSTCMTIPTLSWATSYWDGEQLGSTPRGPNPLDHLPLDAFRCEFMGRQWGVPAELLCYEKPYTYREALAFSLLHDVLVRGSLGGNLELESKLWKGMEAFGRDEAVFIPYWEDNYVDLGPTEEIMASVWSRAEEGAVVIVSNLGGAKADVTVDLDLEGLALPAQVTATDLITEVPMPVKDGGIMQFPLESFAFRVLWIRPAQ